jgi:hypothetical protein
MPSRAATQANTEAALRAQAKRTALDLTKHRARAYLTRLLIEETYFPEVLWTAPDQIIAVAKRMIAAEKSVPRRWFGFGGEAPLLNAKALLLCGRVLRRAAGMRLRTENTGSSVQARPARQCSEGEDR